MTTATLDEQLSRVRMMSIDKGTTWDLSPNDQAALRAVLASHDRFQELTRRAVKGLKCIGQFSYNDDEYTEPHPLDCTLAGRVSRVFCTGMTRSCELCRECGEDPEHSECAERIAMERKDASP